MNSNYNGILVVFGLIIIFIGLIVSIFESKKKGK